MKAVLNADGAFRMLVPDDASTAPEQTRAWVPAEPPVPGDGEVVEPDAPLVGPESVTQQWRVRQKTRDERVPASVPFGAFRAALELSGIAPSTVEALLDAIPDPQIKIVAKNKFAHATVAERDDPLLRQMGAAMGLSDAQIDDIFVLAPTVW